MDDKEHGGKQDQLDEHSLPGTNQADKGPTVRPPGRGGAA